MVKKQYVAVKQVREFMAKQSHECQAQYLVLVAQLEQDGYLIEPFAKKIDRDIFEIRIRRGRQVRVLYCYQTGNVVVGLHAFIKKTQKTPLQEIRQAKRLKTAIEQESYDE